MNSMGFVPVILGVIVLTSGLVATSATDASAHVTITKAVRPGSATVVLSGGPPNTSSLPKVGFIKVAITAVSDPPLPYSGPCQFIVTLDQPGVITGGGPTRIGDGLPPLYSAAFLIDVAPLFAGHRLSLVNVTVGNCLFSVDIE
jgi:hypothetical protein